MSSDNGFFIPKEVAAKLLRSENDVSDNKYKTIHNSYIKNGRSDK